MNIHDYRNFYWGHNHYMRNTDEGIYKGLCIDTPGFKIGDHIIWEATYGEVVLEVTHSRPHMDPTDMYDVEAKVIKRMVNQSYIDENGKPPFDYELIGEK